VIFSIAFVWGESAMTMNRPRAFRSPHYCAIQRPNCLLCKLLKIRMEFRERMALCRNRGRRSDRVSGFTTRNRTVVKLLFGDRFLASSYA
jgi:hypothetical protein